MNQSFSPAIQKSEWIVFISLFSLIFSVFLISKITSARNLKYLHESKQALLNEFLAIEITGCVQKPGTYSILKGSTIRVALRKARPQPLADLSRIKLDQILEESCQIDLPVLTEVRVQIQGCVKEDIVLVLPAGSRICDLKNKIELSSEANSSFFKRKRILRDGEIIEVLCAQKAKNKDDNGKNSRGCERRS